MNDDKMVFQDSYTEKLDKNCTLKTYLDLNDLSSCEKKLKNFVKVKSFIAELGKVKENEIESVP